MDKQENNNSWINHKLKAINKVEAYNTRNSQAVTQRSTTLALQDLTAGIGRDPVFCLWYGRRRKNTSSNCMCDFFSSNQARKRVKMPLAFPSDCKVCSINRSVTLWRQLYYLSRAKIQCLCILHKQENNNSWINHKLKAINKVEAYNTRNSQAVTQRSTTLALQDLTAGIGRDPVFCLWYGRRRKNTSSSCMCHLFLSRQARKRVKIPLAFPSYCKECSINRPSTSYIVATTLTFVARENSVLMQCGQARK